MFLAQPIEPELSAAYADWIRDVNELQGETEPIVLPPGFPIRSVAGALLDPPYASTSIEDYLRSLSLYRSLELNFATVIANLVRSNIPLADLSKLLKVVRITVEFPDGSTLDFGVSFSIDAVSGNAEMELESVGNARLENGQPAPTGPMGFAGRTFYDRNGSLAEWVLWAQHFNLVVSGANKGTVMRCEISDNVIRCEVIKKP